jgi:TonB family protein
MNVMFKFTYSILAIFALLFLCLETAYAQCACAKPNITALDEYKDATIVFTGEIIDIQRSERDKQDRYYETVKIAVDRVWKENVDSIVTIKYYVYGCVQGWKVGDKYLVYAYMNQDKVTYSTGCCCSRTGKLERSEKDISEFFNYGYARSHVSSPQKEKVIIAGWMNSRAVNFQPPKYPTAIKKPRPAARVEVRVITDVDGNVISAEVSRGPVDFHNAALDAARNLKFPPTLLSGVPTKVSGWISFDFKP